jgi:tape measure domain-containing protein
MTRETIDIIVRENGSRVVKRSLEEIGSVAERSVHGLRLLQNSLFVLGGAGLLSGLTRMLDTLTNFENRLVLVTKSTAELNAVQEELFNIASRTRSSFESTAELYTRLALSVRQLGLSQRETLGVTETLNKATILSGASSREAGAALIQLSQGLSSGRLAGDELRSILEQLPYVADLIGKELVRTGKISGTALNSAKEPIELITGALFNSRSSLRGMGKEGKLTAELIVNSFKNAREEVAEKFGKTIPTIGQSFQPFRNELLRVLDSFDDVTGASAAVANAIILLAYSLNILIGSVIAATTAFAGWKIGSIVSSLISWLSVQRQISSAVASGNATMLTAVGIEQAKAASSLQAASAESALVRAKVWSLQVEAVQLQSQRALLLQQKASIVLDNSRRIARDALTGRFIAYNAAVAQNIRSNIALQRTETALLATKSQLTAATAAQTTATAALSAAQTRSATANAAAGGILARLSTAFPGLAAIVRGVAAAFSGLWAIIVANPIGALIALIVAAVSTLVFFSNKISVTEDGMVTLRDIGVATFQLIMEAIAPIGAFLVSTFGPAVEFVNSVFSQLWNNITAGLALILTVTKTHVNLFIGLWVGEINAVIRAWGIFPAALMDIGKIAINGLLTVVENGVNGILAAIQSILDLIGQAAVAIGQENPFSDMFGKVDLSQYRQELSGAASEVGKIFSEEFGKSLSTDYVGNAMNAILERARQKANERLANSSVDLDSKGIPGKLGSGSDGSKNKSKTFADYVRDLTLENEVLRENISLTKENQKIAEIQRALKRALTADEKVLIGQLVLENEALKKMQSIFQDIKGPAEDYKISLTALNELLKQGKINQPEFTKSVVSARITFLETQTDAVSGMERGLLKLLQKTGDYASQVEDIITSAFDGMSSALADFIVDGEADFSSLIRSISKQLVQLALSQAFQMVFSTVLGKFSSMGNIYPPAPLPFAKGGVFTNSIVSSPAAFQSSLGLGVMGEKGPEAVVPLSRTKDGKLGVQTNGRGGGANITFNIIDNVGVKKTEERSKSPNGDEIVNLVISEVDKGFSSGKFDGSAGSRFGLRPGKVNR